MFNKKEKIGQENIAGKKEKKNSKFMAWLNTFLLQYFKLSLAGFIILFLLSGYFLFLNPKYREIKKNVALTNESTKNVSNNLSHYLNILNNYIKNFDEINPVIKDKISKVLPVGSNKKELYVLMEQIAEDQNLFLTSVEIVDSSSVKTVKVVPKNAKSTLISNELGLVTVDMNFIGVDYDKMKSLLNEIEKSLQIIDIQAMVFDPGAFTLALTMNTYYLKMN